MNTRRLTAVVAAVTIVATAAAWSPTTTAAEGSGPRWLSIGDSYSSGEGIPATDPPGTGNPECKRANGRTAARAWSVVAYDELWGASSRSANQTFVACTGALASSSRPNDSDATAQLQEGGGYIGSRRADVISFSFGGNDVGFPGVLKDCIDVPTGETTWGAWINGCNIDETEMRRRVDMLVGKVPISGTYSGDRALPEVYDEIAAQVVPGGDVIVLGYPQLVEDLDKWPTVNRRFWGHCQRIRDEDVAMLRSVNGYLNEQIALAVAAANDRHDDVTFHWLDVAAVYESAAGRHGLCAPQPWLNGVTLSVSNGPLRIEGSFHPTQDGHAHTGTALADLVRRTGTDSFLPQVTTSVTPVAPTPTATPATDVPMPTLPPGADPAASCPPLSPGQWSGTWSSSIGRGSGGISANVTVAADTIGGSLALTGPTPLPGGSITGSIDCEAVSFGRVDRTVQFYGTVTDGGQRVSGTYDAVVNSQGGRDQGTFEVTSRN